MTFFTPFSLAGPGAPAVFDPVFRYRFLTRSLSGGDVLPSANRQVASLLHLDAGDPRANSYREFLAYRVLEGILRGGDRGSLRAYLPVLARGSKMSAADVEDFAAGHALGPLDSWRRERRNALVSPGGLNGAPDYRLDASFKVSELEVLPEARSYRPPEPGDPVEGGLHTAFVRGSELARAVTDLWEVSRESSPEGLEEAGVAWKEAWDKTASRGEPDDPRRIAASLGFFQDPFSAELAERIGKGEIKIVVLPPEKASSRLEAYFEWSECPRLRPSKIFLVDLFRKYPRQTPSKTSRRLASRLRHDGLHLLQKERGETWLERHFLAAEMEAFAFEASGALAAGDAELITDMSRITPYGFAMGVRQFIEQVYFRGRSYPGYF